MSLQFRSRRKTVLITTALFTYLSALMLLIGFIAYIWDINEALSDCWWQMDDQIKNMCKPGEENCKDRFLYYEPTCQYTNEQLITSVSVLLLIGGIFAILALSCYCYSINLTTPLPKKCCSNRCLLKGFASLATIGGLLSVYSLAFFISGSHYPAAKRPARDSDSVYYALTYMGAFTFLAVGMLLAIIGLLLLCCITTNKEVGDYEEEAINI
ncbi:unnamed protein product [Meganyctiphanes norvegica]|uniref:Claudin n=1 Tax=Meganyctiphanes norvegica TaxID=48144 RepID=A0AAV2S744_MEGNR